MTVGLEVKLASLVIHCEEVLDSRERGGIISVFDLSAIKSLVTDPEVQRFINDFDQVMLPMKRDL